MAELLKELSQAHGVSGNEHAVRELILGEIREKTDAAVCDSMGNLIAHKKGKSCGKTIAVAVNMDEPGFIVSEITDKGYLKFKSVGNVDPRKVVSKKVVTAGGVKGVIGMKAIHLQTKDEREAAVKVKNLFIDIGAVDKADAEKRVKLGEYITFDTEFAVAGENVKGKALDRSGACYALIKALEADYPYDFYAIFTTQHETGARGANIAAHRVNADVLLTISSADTDDMYDCKNTSLKLGGGVVISLRDKTAVADKVLSDKLISIAKENGIKINVGVTMPNSSDGCRAQLEGAALVNAVIPCRYSRSPVSIMNLGDVEETVKLIKLYLNKIGEII